MKIATDRRKNIISHVKGTLDTMLRVEANSASCGVTVSYTHLTLPTKA